MKHCILIVEDHETVRNSLRKWLTLSIPDCLIMEAPTAEDALDAVRRSSPDIVLMDISLPQMDGIEATRRIKSALPGTKIIIVSIHEDDEHRASATVAGAFAYVPKRNMQEELIPVILASLQEGNTLSPVIKG